jgi:TolB-like protein/Tfp pilus assembly protein PilF
MKLIEELERKNIPRLAVAYVVTSWLVIQVADTILPYIGFSEKAVTIIIIVAAIGFLPFLIFAWMFEFTPKGLEKEDDIDRGPAAIRATSRTLDITIIIILLAGIMYFAFDKFVLNPQREVELVETAVRTAIEQAELVAAEATDASIAVMPFVNMSSDPEQEYFSDGLSEELLNLLARIPELRVAARTSSFAFKGEKIDIPTVADKLNVAYVLEGSVRKASNQIRITAQLIRGSDGYHLWSETFDRSLEDIFAMQDEIAESVVGSLHLTLLGNTPRARVVDPEAYALFLQGRYFNDLRDQENWAKAAVSYQKALDIDPDYAEAWAGLSITYSQQASWGFIGRDEGIILAREAVRRALALDPKLPEAHASLGWIRMVYDFDWYGADASYHEALNLAPGNATVLRAAGVLAFTLGRLDEAIDINLRAIVRDPLNQGSHQNLGLVLMHAGRLEESAQKYRHVLELNSEYPGAYMRLGQISLLQGKPDEASELISQETDSWWQAYGFALASMLTGPQDKADENLAQFIKNHDDGPFQTAELYAFNNQPDKAFEWLQRAYEERDSGMHEMKNDPFLANIMEDPRWQPFLEKMGLATAQVAGIGSDVTE